MTLNTLINVAADPAGMRRLQQLDVRITDVHDQQPGASVMDPALLAQQDVFFSEELPDNHASMTRLKYVQINSAGYSQVIGLGLPERGIRVCNASGVFDTAIAEWCMAMMINLHRDLRTMIGHQEQGVWSRQPIHQKQLRGLTVGFWGYGGLAREAARLCKAMGMTVHTMTRAGVKPMVDRYIVPGTGDPQGTLPDRSFMDSERSAFLSGLDFLVMALPLTPSTRGLCKAVDLRQLPPHAMLLNPARGPLIEEAALLQALNEKWIAGAALDTHYYYPMPPEHPLWKMPNVIMTPHISGSSGGDYFLPRLWDIFTSNIQRLLTGQPLLNELPAAALV